MRLQYASWLEVQFPDYKGNSALTLREKWLVYSFHLLMNEKARPLSKKNYSIGSKHLWKLLKLGSCFVLVKFCSNTVSQLVLPHLSESLVTLLSFGVISEKLKQQNTFPF